MIRPALKEKIGSGILVLDGAMGTQLIARGAPVGVCNDYLCVESPEIVKSVHQAYIDAESDAVLTNTFGANSFTLKRHGYAGEVQQINSAAVKIAREAAGDNNYVLGDIGPTGELLKPLGMTEPQDVQDAFREQAAALVKAGVDGLIIETMTAIEEIELAVKAAKSIAGDLPVFASMSFEAVKNDFRTMMGISVDAAVAKLVPLDIDAVGFNCGKASLEDYIALTEKFASAIKASGGAVKLLAEPNAGLPEIVGTEAVYRVTPDEYATAIEKIKAAGASIIGGCCGTTPEHLKAAADKLKNNS